MLPVWSSDRAHAGRCLAKADCRFTSSKTAMGLKKKVARATWKRDTCAFVDGFFGCRYFPRFNLVWCLFWHGETVTFATYDVLHAMETQALASSGLLYLNSGCWPQNVLYRSIGAEKKSHLLHCDLINWCNIILVRRAKIIRWFHTTVYVLSCHRTLEPLRQKSLERVFVTTAVWFILQRGFRLRQGSTWLR